ncbi:MAG: hypothetical protein B6I20_00620 [Bacteroidetes bacterium 4572_117]|nr:MAG: hypothetical protein B6I20_00620 [Bacteroidetes bacterium 4572_117]
MTKTEKLKLDVCLSPDLIGNFKTDNTIIVIIDIIRASTTICTALHYGVDEIITFADVELAIDYKNKGYITAGERGGDKLEGFDMGNSPLSFMTPGLKSKKLAITTTNGTKTISLISEKLKENTGTEIIVGAFVNYKVLFDYLISANKNILLLCSGWKGNVSVEDTLFAGKLAAGLEKYSSFEHPSDSANHAKLIYSLAEDDLFGFIMDQSMRFKNIISNLGNDIRYCLKMDVTDALPMLENGKFINKKGG